ncbi:HTH-type transcriptional regulator MalT [Oxobacter pfennigii]|uniref:HTH-type transcriptional regulator MalT n=1 Tax=Oxobacter pfennigii TaxID=36849 RepID=A0A0P9AH55_9CLOT|nr:BTAD domain-containing putative transcriptional regulator [Oxobacter pfennigii]KPU44787.1 HTH-type transcriptional regulator MalT [Oxobacter pfennigii]
MDNIPVLKSKLIMPELSGSFLLTDRLTRLHENMKSCRAVTVCAPAGYGKTTLVVSYFNRQAAMPSRVCWYRLDPEDKNLPVFIAHLKEAVFPAETAEFSESRKALFDNSGMQLQPHNTISMICHEMWAHHSKAGHIRTYIVLDDFQNVVQVQDICDMIRYMLDNLPPSCAIFILNRANLNVFTEKQKLEKKILEIGTDGLAFNNAEIKDLMLSMGQIAADRKVAGFIEKNTEGWIAGIIILCQAVKSKGSDTASIELAKLGHEDALFRYMSMEVLKSVDNVTQDALARLALLQDFSESEASEILEINDIKSLIEQCMGFGMFIQRIPGDPVVYRFHSLFREFLLYILKDRYYEGQIAGLHLQAAQYYMRHATYGRAAEHMAKCGDSASVMDMVTKEGFNKFMIGETGQLKMWLDLLPEDMIRSNPVLLLFKAQLMPNNRQIEMVDTLKEVLNLSLQNNNLAIYYDAASVLIYIFMCSNNMKGLLEMTEGLPKQRQKVSVELRNTLIVLDMVHSIGEEQFSMAEAQSESIIYTLLPEDSKWLYLILSCIIYYCLGKLDNGKRCMETALILDKFKNIEPSRGFILLFLSIILSLKNQRECLPSYIAEILAIGEKYDYEYLSAHGRRLAAFERYLSFEGEASVEMLDHAVFNFRRINNKAMAAACRLLRRLWAIRYNSPVLDLDEAREDLEVIREECPGMMVYEYSLSVLGAIARESGDFNLAEYCLLSSIKEAKAKKGYQVLCGSCFHIAKLYFAGGGTEKGHYYLKQAMELAESNRYFMFWDIHIPTVVEMTLRSIRYGYCTGYAEELLSKFYGSKTVKYLSEKAKAIDESRIEAFVGDFVSTYKADSSEQLYFVKSSLFGKPEISVNGIKVSDAEWKTKKVRGFLEYLLLNSGNTMSKEVLAETFWPGSDSKSAIASQRTALYHLRKILSKYNAEVTGSNAFIYETPEGLQIRKNDILDLDIHEFLRLHSELFSNIVTSQTEQRQADILERMIYVYKGDLMEGSDYGDLVFYERERLKSIFMEVCLNLGSIYIKRGELRRAEEILRRALAAEPYNENICLELLKLYMSQGRKSKSVKLYYSFKKRLEQELDIKVDRRLTEVIQSKRLEK